MSLLVHTSNQTPMRQQQIARDMMEPLHNSKQGHFLGGLYVPHEVVFFSPQPLSALKLEEITERLGDHGPTHARPLQGLLWVVPQSLVSATQTAMHAALPELMGPFVAEHGPLRYSLDVMVGVWHAPSAEHALVGALTLHPELSAALSSLSSELPTGVRPLTPMATSAPLSTLWTDTLAAGDTAAVAPALLARVLWPQLSPLVKASFLPGFKAAWDEEALRSQMDALETPAARARPRL